ncbi:MAG TPA: DinB family protein [Ignavibacteria bacterium]|nr:DinB family protein [Ignavibacteria bacterium]
MIYKTIEEFFKDWAYESESTLKMFNNFTVESMNQKVTGDGRSLGFLGWHITETINEMVGRTGLKLFSPDMEHYDSKNPKHLQECYKNASDSLVEKLKANWTDETLMQEDDMYGENWKRGFTLSCLITHQIHHRGQVTVLMRQAGLKVPGVYGPSKEEWVAYGMEPHP